jgi:hypothetical protein
MMLWKEDHLDPGMGHKLNESSSFVAGFVVSQPTNQASHERKTKKTHDKAWVLISSGGERGIRTPGPVTVNGFQDRRVKPLCHLSAAKIHARVVLPKNLLFLL